MPGVLVLLREGDPEAEEESKTDMASSQPMTDSVELAGGVGSDGGGISPPPEPPFPHVITCNGRRRY